MIAHLPTPNGLLALEPPVAVGAPRPKPSTAGTTTRRDSVCGSELDAVLPPIVATTAAGEPATFYVSAAPASRYDVLALSDALGKALEERQARAVGLCPVRSDVYAEVFDELIRQVTVDAPERGALLRRVRDQARVATDAHAALYDSAVTFAVRKQVQAEEGVPELEAALADLEARTIAAAARAAVAQRQLEAAERRSAERRALADKRRADELTFLKHQIKHLDAFVRATLR